MAVKKKGLGRGLDALFPEKTAKPVEKKPEPKSAVLSEGAQPQTEDVTTASTVKRVTEVKTAEIPAEAEPKKSDMLVKISKVEPNRTQPRKQFDEDALLELSESIKQFGILQPLLVSNKGDYYEIIAGERRWRAAKLAGLKEVPVIIKEFNDQQVVEISLIENIQREDLNPIEEAMAYRRLIDEFKLKQDSIAERVSKSRTAVTNSLRLLKLDDRVQQMLIDEMISAGHARAILAIPDKEKQASVAMKVFDEKLSVRETEKLVKHIVEPPKKKTEKPVNMAEDAIYESLEEKMKGIIGTRVFIHRKKNNKGKIEIEYYSRDELERIIELFESIR
nr:ParB/RepB/Spo0J family partition protein [uncultured Blautia sp.]